MRVRGPNIGAGRSGPTAGWGRSEIGGLDPSADGRGGGPGDLRLSLGEHHADQQRPPGRVIATQGEDRLSDLIGIGMVECQGGMIAGKEAGIAAFASPFQKMADGAG
jgi:hypothetical protein